MHRQPGRAARLRSRMPLDPLPPLVALVGWLDVFGAPEPKVLADGLASLALGRGAFAPWDASRPAPPPEPTP